MFDDYSHSPRCPACPSLASSSSSSSCKLSLKNFHVGRRTAITTTTTAAAIDIAHLLDPAYYSPKHHTTAFMSSNQVYVDPSGETHDPDFRLFATATHSPKRREFLSTLSNTNVDDDDEDACYYQYNSSSWGDEDKENRRYRQRSSFDSFRSPSRASEPIYTYSNYQHFDQSYAYRPTNDWQEEPDVFSLSEDEKERQPRSQTRSRRESNKLRRRRAESEPRELEEEYEGVELWKDEEGMDYVREDGDDEMEPKGRQARSMSPLSGSTTDSFRRQWLALRLRTQFAAFRARRKMTKLVKCATATAAA